VGQAQSPLPADQNVASTSRYRGATRPQPFSSATISATGATSSRPTLRESPRRGRDHPRQRLLPARPPLPARPARCGRRGVRVVILLQGRVEYRPDALRHAGALRQAAECRHTDLRVSAQLPARQGRGHRQLLGDRRFVEHRSFQPAAGQGSERRQLAMQSSPRSCGAVFARRCMAPANCRSTAGSNCRGIPACCAGQATIWSACWSVSPVTAASTDRDERRAAPAPARSTRRRSPTPEIDQRPRTDLLRYGVAKKMQGSRKHRAASRGIDSSRPGLFGEFLAGSVGHHRQVCITGRAAVPGVAAARSGAASSRADRRRGRRQ
jgi:hypothetical protein